MRPEKIATAAFGVSLLVMIGVSVAQSENVFFLSVDYENGELGLSEVFVKSGSPPEAFLGDSDYKYEIISFGGDNIHSSKFGLPRDVLIDDVPSVGGTLQLDNFTFSVIAPYFADAREIRLLGIGNETLLSVDVSGFTIEPKSPDVATEISADNSLLIIVSIAVVVALAIIVYVFMASKKPKDPFASLKRKWS